LSPRKPRKRGPQNFLRIIQARNGFQQNSNPLTLLSISAPAMLHCTKIMNLQKP